MEVHEIYEWVMAVRLMYWLVYGNCEHLIPAEIEHEFKCDFIGDEMQPFNEFVVYPKTYEGEVNKICNFWYDKQEIMDCKCDAVSEWLETTNMPYASAVHQIYKTSLLR